MRIGVHTRQNILILILYYTPYYNTQSDWWYRHDVSGQAYDERRVLYYHACCSNLGLCCELCYVIVCWQFRLVIDHSYVYDVYECEIRYVYVIWTCM